MRVPLKARGLVGVTIAAGGAVLVAAPFAAAFPSLTVLAFLGAAVVATELLQVGTDESSLDPGDAHGISFSSGVHIAIAIVAGPWIAAPAAAFGVVVVDRVRGCTWRRVAFNASVFALAAFAGGWAFHVTGGRWGVLEFPGDLHAIAALAAGYYAVNIFLTSAVVAFHAGTRALALSRDATRDALAPSAGEAGLGVLLALVVLDEPWAAVALVPLVFAVYRSYERLAALRRKTAHALETFANVVDERDQYTYQHSARVADHVRSLAEALALPPRTVADLRWAGRLHDLGKIAVDTSILHKAGALGDDEWAALRMHPRLSARLLRRFHDASDYARAVEYHHERYDGEGYYGVEASELSLAAHFLIVADTFDAMTSDRPYRDGLPPEVALAEIERNAGRQFHPAVAKAFVALQRGFDPLMELSARELAEIRALASRHSSRRRLLRRVRDADVAAVGGVLGALVALGFGAPIVAGVAAAVAAAGFASSWQAKRAASRLADALHRAASEPASPHDRLTAVVAALAHLRPVRWAGLVAWRERESAGTLELEWEGGGEAPSETSLTSWLIREAESVRDVAIAPGEELGRPDTHVFVPLERHGEIAGYLVVAVADPVPAVVREALRRFAADAPALLPVDDPARKRGAKAVLV